MRAFAAVLAAALILGSCAQQQALPKPTATLSPTPPSAAFAMLLTLGELPVGYQVLKESAEALDIHAGSPVASATRDFGVNSHSSFYYSMGGMVRAEVTLQPDATQARYSLERFVSWMRGQENQENGDSRGWTPPYEVAAEGIGDEIYAFRIDGTSAVTDPDVLLLVGFRSGNVASLLWVMAPRSTDVPALAFTLARKQAARIHGASPQ
jgi:hypothetical protein